MLRMTKIGKNVWIDLTSGRVLSSSTSSNPGGMVGMVMIVTGKQEKKLKFTSCESRGDHEVNLGIKMIALVCKATRWKKYNKNTHKRIFRVINHDGSTFASYDQDEMKDFTLGDVIEIMNFPKGKVLKLLQTCKKLKMKLNLMMIMIIIHSIEIRNNIQINIQIDDYKIINTFLQLRHYSTSLYDDRADTII